MALHGQEFSPEEIKERIFELRSKPEFDSKDTTHISLINELCFSIRFKNLDTVLILANQALALSKEANYKKGETASLNSLANFYAYSGKSETAIAYADSSLKLASSNDFDEQSINACNTLGVSYFQLTDYPNSYKYFLKGSEFAIRNNNKEQIAGLYMNIGTMYSLLQDYEEALTYYDKALLVANKNNVELTKWQIKSNIAYMESNIGNYESALKNIDESIEFFKDSHLKQWLAFSYTTKGGIYLKLEEFENAHIFYQKARAVQKTLQDGKGKADMIYGLADSYAGLNELDEAEKLAKQALQMYKEIQLKTGIQKSYTTLYEINEAKNNSTKALHFLKLARKLSDTIARETNKTNLKMLRTKLDFQKEKELLQEQSEAKIEKQLSITRWTVFALFGSLLFGYLIFNANQREKRLNKKLNNETRNLERREFQLRELNTTQEKLFSIIGHDLKGPISSLTELLKVMSKEDDSGKLMQNLIPKLKNYTNHVHFTLENLLNWGENQMKGEIVTPSKINLHLACSNVIGLLSEAILKKELNVELNIENQINAWADKEDVNVIFRNLLSNAIKFTHPKGQILITAKIEEKGILIAFKDNGVGMTLETQKLVFETHRHYSTFGTNNEKGTGMGLMLIKELLIRNKGKIEVKSYPNNGSTFFIYLPKVASALSA